MADGVRDGKDRILKNTDPLFTEIAENYPHPSYTSFCNELGVGYNSAEQIRNDKGTQTAALKQVLNEWLNNGKDVTREKLEVALKNAKTGGLVNIVKTNFAKYAVKKESAEGESAEGAGSDDQANNQATASRAGPIIAMKDITFIVNNYGMKRRTNEPDGPSPQKKAKEKKRRTNEPDGPSPQKKAKENQNGEHRTRKTNEPDGPSQKKKAKEKNKMASEGPEESQRLDCSICHDLPEDPKLLACGHTFCKKCLALVFQSQMRETELSCPDCSKITPITDSDVSTLEINTELEAKLEAMKSAEKLCSICEEGEESPAVAYCQTCKDNLCDNCLDVHRKWKKNVKHEVVNINDIKTGGVKVKQSCPKHPANERECICTSCKVAICLRCRVEEHSGPDHNVEEVPEFLMTTKSDIGTLQEKSRQKIATVENHVKIVDEEYVKVDEILDETIMSINEMYKESLTALLEEKTKLIDKCKRYREVLVAELQHARESDVQLIDGYKSASELVGNGAKVLLEGQALSVHNNISADLQKLLKHREPSDEQATNITKKAENVEFRLYRDKLGLGEVILNNWTMKKAKEYALSGSYVYDLVPELDGKMTVGYLGGGIKLFTVDGPQEMVRTRSKPTDRPSSKTGLHNENVGHLAVLSDGRYVVQNNKHIISLYTREWKKENVEFETLHEDGLGGMGVDVEDHIYVGYWSAKKILVFSPEGGAPINEIPCHDYDPMEICPMRHSKMLVVRDLLTVRVIDENGTVKHEVDRNYIHGRMAVLRDDNILIGWVKSEGVLCVEMYNHHLKHVTTVLSAFPFKGEFRMMREFSTGEIAICDNKNFYVFLKTK